MSTSEPQSTKRTKATIDIAAGLEQCSEVILDIDSYPRWVQGVVAAEVLSRDEDGRPLEARFDIEGLGRRASYTLKYDLSATPSQISWHLLVGDVAKEIDGRYLLSELEDESGTLRTSIVYELAIDLAISLPGFVARRAEDKIVDAALRRLKKEVESRLEVTS